MTLLHPLLAPLLSRFNLMLTVMCISWLPLKADFVPPQLPEDLRYLHDIEIGVVDGFALNVELVIPAEKPDEPWPAIVYIHGGGWNHGNKNDHAKRIAGYARKGFVAVAVEYRFAPEYSHPAQISDVAAAIRFLKANAARYHLDPERIAVWGTSAGGHLAALLGTRGGSDAIPMAGLWTEVDDSVAAVVDFCGPAAGIDPSFVPTNKSLRNFLGGTPEELPEIIHDAMPVAHVSSDDPPFFVVHGGSDTVVPVQSSRLFVAALKEAGVPVEYHEYPDATHGVGHEVPESQTLAMAFLDRVLKRGDRSQDHD